MNNAYLRSITGILLAIIAYCLYQGPTEFLASVLVLLFLRAFLYELPQLIPNNAAYYLVVPLFLLIPISSALALHASKYKPVLAICCMLTWSFDTGAYIIGTLYGKNKIAPQISPGKTVQGVAGGLATTLCTAVFLLYFYSKSFMCTQLFFVLILCIAAFLGDLFESWLKRRAKIKDSGQLLPGHGGIFDRFDSLFATLPLCYLLRKNIVQLFFN